MTVFDELNEIVPQRIWNGVAARAVHGQRVTFSVIELDADTVIPEHAHENEQLGMVIQGGLTFRIGREARSLEPGGTWCIPANVPHAVDVGPDGAVVLDVFAPVRDDYR